MAKIDKIIVKENGIENKVDSIENKTIDLLRYYPGKVLNMSIKGNSSQSGTPTPSSPIEIQSVGDKTKNLFDISKAENGTLGSQDGANLGTDAYPNRCRSGFIYLTAGNYTISFKELISTGSYLHRYSSNNQNSWLGSLTFTKSGSVSKFTLTSNCYIRFTIQPIDTSSSLVLNTETLSKYEPQLEKGTTATEYEPYGYNIPIIVDKIDNKNLFGGYDTILKNVYIDASGNYVNKEGINTYEYIKVEPNTTYTISGKSDSKGYIRVAQYDINKKFITRVYNSVIVNPRITITTTATTKYLALCPDVNFTDGTVTNSSIYDIQIEKGSVATDYEPYIKQQIINIKAKEPLRKIGDYTDTLDYANKRIIRKIASEFITNVLTMSGDATTYRKFLTDIKYKPLLSGASIDSKGFAISNKFKQSTVTYKELGNYSNLIQTYITTGGVNRCVYTFNSTSVQTVEAAQPLIGNGFEICYVMASDITETIEVPEIKAGKNTKFEFDTLEPSSFSITAFEDYEVSLI